MSILADLRERLHALVFRARDERELDEELRFHVEMEAEHWRRAGADPADARRLGAIALGGIEPTKEAVRDASGVRAFSDVRGDVAYALRGLRQRPGFAAVVILTLAIGIGGTTAVFTAVDAVLIRPLPFPQSGQLVRLYQNYLINPAERGFVTPVHFLAYRERMTAFDRLAALNTYRESGGDISTADGARRIRLLKVSADYFDVFRTAPELGHGFTSGDETGARVVVLSRALWMERFGGAPSAIGRTLTMNGLPYVVVGVMPNGFEDPIAGRIDAWIPLDLTPGRDLSNVNNHYLSAVGRLAPGVTMARAQSELDALGRTLAREYPDAKNIRARLYSLKDDIVGSSRRALELMLAASAAVLLLVCVNVANLLLVRGSEREREFALRAALGADRRRIVRQLLVESLVLAAIGDAAGLVIARAAMLAIVRVAGGAIPRLAGLSVDPRVLAFSVGAASFSAVVFGLVPALRASRIDPNEALRGETRSSTGSRAHGRLRAGLVVSQVALAFVLLVASGLLIESVRTLHALDLGVRTNDVLTFDLALPSGRYDSLGRARMYEDVARRLESIPGIIAAGGVSKLPATGPYNQWDVQALTGPLAGATRGDVQSEERVISGDYLRAVGIRVLRGRAFDDADDGSAPRRMLLSSNLAARLFPGVDPIGQRIRTGGNDGVIIGVVSDVAVDDEGRPDYYVYHAHRQYAGDRNWELTQTVATSGATDRFVPDVRRAIAALDPELVLNHPMALADAIGEGSAQRVFTLRLLGAFAATALVLAALGLFGVLSYGVKLRTREIGIRVALGARIGTIRSMVLRQGLALAVIGVGIGLVGAAAMAHVMSSIVFHVSPLDPRVIAAAVVFMVVVAGVSAYLPARRATAIDPRTALQ